MHEFITQQSIINALKQGWLDPDSEIIIDVEEFGEPFKATSVCESEIEGVIELIHNPNDWAAEVREITEAHSLLSPSKTNLAFFDGGDLFLFYEMDIQNTEGFGPNLILRSDGTPHFTD